MRRKIRMLLILPVFVTFLVFYLHSRLGAEVTRHDLLSFHQSSTEASGDGSKESLYCVQFPKDMSLYPKCYEKMMWLFSGWKSHTCYANYGVDGSVCSFRRYLSVVEHHCPPLASGGVSSTPIEGSVNAEPRVDILQLFDAMGSLVDISFIRDRLSQHWSSWTEALERTLSKYPNSMMNRKRMDLVLHLGLLADSNFHIGEKSSSGGPLGELLQWTDLIACLFLLGHNLYISADKTTLLQHLDQFPSGSPCPSRYKNVGLIITDIIGLRSFRKRKDFLVFHKCRIRLVDSFGTHVEFNSKSYFDAHYDALGMKGKSSNPWGGHELNLLQYLTFFPHTPDNSFLGFAVHRSNVKPTFERNSHVRPASLIYGKEKYMWDGSEAVIDVLRSLTEVHATVADADNFESGLFSNVTNHGFLNGTEITALLRSVNIFVGLGFPLEGPAPLEAIAQGAVFINPKFNPPKSRMNMMFLHDKPTLREFSSQLPYLERLGKPYVYTVDFSNISAFKNAIKNALNEKPHPYIPEEFTPEGMLIRVNMLVSRDLCSDTSVWPPSHAFMPRLSGSDESCENACLASNLVCEPSFFPLINSAAVLESIAGCSPIQVLISTKPYAPFRCSMQSSSSMFSCASRPPVGSGTIRVCPCRDYLPEQVAFCRNCVS